MSTGTRTVLLSRWRSGGQSSLDLVREFTQELPHTTPADAWQRAVQVVSNVSRLVRGRAAAEEGPFRQHRVAGGAPVLLGRIHADRRRQPGGKGSDEVISDRARFLKEAIVG